MRTGDVAGEGCRRSSRARRRPRSRPGRSRVPVRTPPIPPPWRWSRRPPGKIPHHPADPVRVAGGALPDRPPHRLDRRVRDDPPLMPQVVAEVEHPEADEVVGAAEHRRPAGVVEVVERDRTLVRRVPGRRELREPRADVDRRPGKTQRLEHLVPHEVGVRLPRDALDDVVEDPEAEVRVVPALIRRRHEVRVAADRLVHVGAPVRFVLVEELVVEGEAGRVAGHSAHRRARRVPRPVRRSSPGRGSRWPGRRGRRDPVPPRIMSPVAVIGFEIEAREYIVCSEAGIRRSRSAHPKPSSHTTSPPSPTATAMEGWSQATSAPRISSRTAEEVGAGLGLNAGSRDEEDAEPQQSGPEADGTSCGGLHALSLPRGDVWRVEPGSGAVNGAEGAGLIDHRPRRLP